MANRFPADARPLTSGVSSTSTPNCTVNTLSTDTTRIPTFPSYILGKPVQLDQVSSLTDRELELLEIETLAALEENRRTHESIENKQSDDAGTAYRRMKVAGYFQAAIKIALSDD